MDVDLSGDQELLRDTTEKYVRASCPLPTVRELADGGTGLELDYWRQGAELGWFAMLVPEEFGGGSVSGDGLRDLAIVAEERGRFVQPGPFIGTNVVAAALARSGQQAQKESVLPAIASGEAIAAWAASDSVGSWAPRGTVSATKQGDGFVLSGKADLVQGGSVANWFLVSADVDGAPTQFLVESDRAGVSSEALKSMDITQRFASVSFDNVAVSQADVVGEVGGAAADIEYQLDLALMLVVSETVGAMDVLFDMTRVYAIDRTAFGRPIGSFQAVKHQLADLSLAVEASKAVGWAASDAVAGGRDDAGEVASIAKAWVGDAGIDVSQGCLQVFGGIGYTWEHDLHLYLRRITMNSTLFGNSDYHRERICQLHEFQEQS